MREFDTDSILATKCFDEHMTEKNIDEELKKLKKKQRNLDDSLCPRFFGSYLIGCFIFAIRVFIFGVPVLLNALALSATLVLGASLYGMVVFILVSIEYIIRFIIIKTKIRRLKKKYNDRG